MSHGRIKTRNADPKGLVDMQKHFFPGDTGVTLSMQHMWNIVQHDGHNHLEPCSKVTPA